LIVMESGLINLPVDWQFLSGNPANYLEGVEW
jgi:hypothetical protein